ncbi:MAG TPA: GTP 3',8-cyclase MoaA [Thermoanaerobaculia bacterium]|nr:GTP 3',8-cyclase MoaA [Thermoanaerobaculia bacterium]
MLDARARPLRDVRISVTDRCNFRCVYCMPKEIFGRDFAFVERDQLLTFEEIARMVRILAPLGVEKVRLTGGEPLLRRDLPRLIEQIASIEGITDIALTTNGSLLTREQAAALAGAGLRRVTISLDSLDDETFRRMNDVNVPVDRVLSAIDAAAAAGLAPVKLDMVVVRGLNEASVADVAGRFRGTGHIVRFIEYMDVGNTNGWRTQDVVGGEEIVRMIAARWPVEPAEPNYFGEVASRWRYADGAGEFGVITSVTQPFCGSCTRIRISASGEIYTCLFSGTGHDLRSLLRSSATDAAIESVIASIWRRRDDRYSEIRSEATAALPKVEMSHIGG